MQIINIPEKHAFEMKKAYLNFFFSTDLHIKSILGQNIDLFS